MHADRAAMTLHQLPAGNAIPESDNAGQPLSARRPAAHRALVYGALLLIILFATATSLRWVQTNVLLIGRDPPGHLQLSLEIADILGRGGPQALFQAITLDDFRPPLLYLLTQPFYLLGGRSADTAQLTNIALFAAILWLTFLLARRATGDWMALFAVGLLSLLPMALAMTRLYYMENSLTAALLLALYALLRSDSFRRRGWALVFGVALGIAFLSKWTALVYLALPLLYVLWSGGFWSAQRGALRTWRPQWRAVLAALGGGVLLALLWYLPNRAFIAAESLPLGDWMPALSAVIFALCFYALLVGKGQVGHFWTALLVALAIASLWYLPRIGVVTTLTDVAFGTDRGTNAPPDLLRPEPYLRYFGFWIDDHMGLLPTLVIVPAALLGWVMHWRRREPTPQVAVICWLALVGTWAPFTLLTQADPRNLAPLLPLIAILLAAGLRGYPRAVAPVLGAAWIAVLLVQWSLITFDGMSWVKTSAPALWVDGKYTPPPASGAADPRYWIGPDVLATVGSPEGDAETLGMLIDTWEIHRGKLRYLLALDRLNLVVTALTEEDESGWGATFANRWILLKDGDNRDVMPTGQAILARIAQGDALFHQLYAPVQRYPLPNGETATLYGRDGPRQPLAYPVILIETSPVADTLNQWWSEHATLVFGDRDVAVWTAVHDLAATRVLMPGPTGDFPAPLDALTDTIFVVSRYDQAARDQIAADSYFARTFASGDTILDVFGRPRQPLQTLPAASPWAEIAVDSVQSLPQVAPGEVLPVELALTARTDRPLKLSLRLLAPDGAVVAQNDVPADPAVKFGLLAPPDAPAGAYTLGAVLYDPATMAELPTLDGAALGEIASITVAE